MSAARTRLRVEQGKGLHRTKRDRSRVSQRDYVGIGLWAALLISALGWSIPFAIMFFTSVKSPADITQLPPWFLPTDWAWSNYLSAADIGDLWNTGMNSLLISLVKVPIGLLLSAAAAFAIARLRFRAHRLVLGLFVIGSMVPVQVALGPLFNTILALDLLHSLVGLLLPYLAFGVPYQIFVLYGFFRAIPDELEESARMDGASTARIFWQICIPLVSCA